LGAPDRYAVFGHPVGHSRSPWIHARFAELTGQALVYEARDVPPGASMPRWRSSWPRAGRA
jgi:shikimate dehydrogenase